MATSGEDSSKTNIWLLDSACSHHLTSNKSLFTTFDTSFKSKVKIGNENYLDILGLAKERYTLLFRDEACTVIDPNGDELCTITMRNNSYPFNLANTAHLALYNELDMLEMWHRRFGHVNYNSLSLMPSKNLVDSLPRITKPDKLCQACQFGEQTRVLDSKTSYKKWFDHKPSVSYLKTFGYIYYAKRTKFDLKSVITMLVGYNEVSKGYWLYDTKLMKVFVSKDVMFDEGQSWNRPNATSEKIDFVTTTDDLILQHDSDNESNLEDENKAVRGTRSLEDIYSRSNVALVEPSSFREAHSEEHWKSTMDVEIQMIRKNGTWILVDRPVDKNIIGVKWIYKTKLNLDGSVNKYKAQLVVKGFAQVYGVKYMETFTLVARHDIIRMLTTLSSNEG
ncbi:Uncharacterized protein TCM_007947 [Theobroma cacao]|uniref:Uncharacterized protein n=1 Tax=Theobroma cacao TaxID=3641 RepID=A0A061E4P1_THECC|nr:Uncharacterized protein TCM_007947 [Theobroma cacao]